MNPAIAAIMRRTLKRESGPGLNFLRHLKVFKQQGALIRFTVGNAIYGSDRESCAMLRLMLLRHAKSSRPSGVQDVERPLSDRGESDARLMGDYMAHHALIPGRAVCSPARRTRDTWTGIAVRWADSAKAVDIVFDARLYGATRQGIVSVILGQDDAVRTLLIIGHNPGLHETAEWLIAAGDVEQRERLREKFPSSALAVIDFALDGWSRIHERAGRLYHFITPRAVEAATNEGPVR
jgi:phosphohistidine phosphatase